jgi:hypothetical protein
MNKNESVIEIHSSDLLTSKKIVEIIDKYPNLKKITCPESIYKRSSKKYITALKQIGIDVKTKRNYEKPKKYPTEGKKVIELLNKNKNPQEIADNLNISVKTVYYLKDTYSKSKIKLKTGKKTKYSDKQIKNIKNSYKNKISVKKISKKENIPIQTVYYILTHY